MSFCLEALVSAVFSHAQIRYRTAVSNFSAVSNIERFGFPDKRAYREHTPNSATGLALGESIDALRERRILFQITL